MKMPHSVAVLLLGAVACLVGCSGVTPPRFSVVDARLVERSETGYVVQFTIEGENRNSKPLPLHDISYTLRTEGGGVFEASRFAGQTLPRYGTARIDLPVSFASDDPAAPLSSGAHDYTLSGHITWQPPGAFSEVLFDAHLRRPESAFREEGRMEFGEGTGD